MAGMAVLGTVAWWWTVRGVLQPVDGAVGVQNGGRRSGEEVGAMEVQSQARPAAEAATSVAAGDAAAATKPLVVNLGGVRVELGRTELEWERMLARIENAPGLSASARAAQTLGLLNGALPEEALEAATEQAVKWLSDADHGLSRPLLLNAATHGRVLSVLFADLMERPDAVRLPGLLAVSRVAGHAYAVPALENLQLLLSVEHGADWNGWDGLVRSAAAGPVSGKSETPAGR